MFVSIQPIEEVDGIVAIGPMKEKSAHLSLPLSSLGSLSDFVLKVDEKNVIVWVNEKTLLRENSIIGRQIEDVLKETDKEFPDVSVVRNWRGDFFELILDTQKTPVFGRWIVSDDEERLFFADELPSDNEQDEGDLFLKQNYRALCQSAPDGVVVADVESQRCIFANLGMSEITGYGEEEINGMNIIDFHPKEDASAFLKEFQDQVQGKTDVSRNIRILKKDKTINYVDIKCRLLTISGRQYLLGFFRDVSLRKEAEDSLEKQKEFIRTILQSIPIAILLIDSESEKIEMVNDVSCALLGLPPEHLCGKIYRDYLSLDLSSDPSNHEGKKSTTEQTIRDFFGDILPVLTTSIGIDFENRHKNLVCLVDISERKKIETQMVQSKKLESLGQLASSLAHEINTPIQYISDNMNFLDELSSAFASTGPLYDQIIKEMQSGQIKIETVNNFNEALEEEDVAYYISEMPSAINQVKQGADHIAVIINSLKKFSDQNPNEKKYSDINEAIRNTITISQIHFREVVDVKLELDEEIPEVNCSIGELNQAIFNILLHSASSIEKKFINGDKKGEIIIYSSLLENEVVIKIRDNATVIEEEEIDSTFDPLRSTGLAVAHSIIVDQHGGTILFESHEGQGTTFIVHLPIHETTRTESELRTW